MIDEAAFRRVAKKRGLTESEVMAALKAFRAWIAGETKLIRGWAREKGLDLRGQQLPLGNGSDWLDGWTAGRRGK